MSNAIDLTGMRFGKLTVLSQAESSRSESGKSVRRWLCQCDCGNTIITTRQNLRKGDTRSCGCLKTQGTKDRLTTHGESKSVLYKRWTAMRKRCNNPNNSDYPHYGGRGIRVCEEWQDYTAFKDWALSHGYSDDLSLDRIDVNGNYEPSNCRFVSMKEQCNNRSNNIFIMYNGKQYTLAELAEANDIQYGTLYARVKRGMCIEDAVRGK